MSPNVGEIHVRDLMKTFRSVPSSFLRLGTIWIELEPLPTTPIRFLEKS